MTNNLLNKPEKDELFLDQTLRPAIWDEYVGQKNIKNNLNILLQAANEDIHRSMCFFMDHQV
jgi:Holliday junction resolvasome RuvABC ATP-dependent DNA helicase subunit